jgi:ubiquinone/menaquinone biosynthesis C-methylase UbiE
MVKDYYDRNVEREWTRLDEHWLEYEITYHHILSYCKKGSKTLDIGGGPGKYAFRLANDGYSVFLADLSDENIAFAKKYQNTTGIKLSGSAVVDARDLTSFDDNTFDIVLCLGPFYHLQRKEDRDKVISEIFRVAKTGGIVFSAFITKYAPIYDLLRKDPSKILEWKELIHSFLETGLHNPKPDSKGFPTAFFVDPSKIEDYFSVVNKETMCLFGCESLFTQSEEKLKVLSEEEKEEWLRLGKVLSTSPMAISNSEHVVYVARKI